MEYLNKSKICREFLNQYSEQLIPELLPKLMKVAIYSLHKAFQKWNFSLEELDQFINYCCCKKNFEFECENNLPSPPCQEYLYPQVNKIQKLRMGFMPPEGTPNSEEDNGIIDCYGYGKFYPNDEVYINEKNNFYDENYYIPPNHSYRNIQLYHRRLKNPKFITQEKNIYPHWWWNLKDDIEQDDYDDEDSILDHISRQPGRFPKGIEDKLKKKAKRYPRNKSFSGIRPVRTHYYDEAKIFPNIGAIPYATPKEGFSPSGEDYSKYPYDMVITNGFGNRNPNLTVANDIDGKSNNPNDNSAYISDKPLYSTSTYFRPQTLGQKPGFDEHVPDTFQRSGNPEANRPVWPNSTATDRFSPQDGKQLSPTQISKLNKSLAGRPMSLDGTLYGASEHKSRILAKKKIKESSAFTYDKKFNVIGAKIKKQGKIKKGLKYSLSGNQLKEDERGIIRRKQGKKIN